MQTLLMRVAAAAMAMGCAAGPARACDHAVAVTALEVPAVVVAPLAVAVAPVAVCQPPVVVRQQVVQRQAARVRPQVVSQFSLSLSRVRVR